MPIYEYICLDCGNRFEELRPMKDADAPVDCDECESEHTSWMLAVFFAQSSGRTIASASQSCAGCAGGSCANCGH